MYIKTGNNIMLMLSIIKCCILFIIFSIFDYFVIIYVLVSYYILYISITYIIHRIPAVTYLLNLLFFA